MEVSNLSEYTQNALKGIVENLGFDNNTIKLENGSEAGDSLNSDLKNLKIKSIDKKN